MKRRITPQTYLPSRTLQDFIETKVPCLPCSREPSALCTDCWGTGMVSIDARRAQEKAETKR